MVLFDTFAVFVKGSAKNHLTQYQQGSLLKRWIPGPYLDLLNQNSGRGVGDPRAKRL